MTEKFNVGLFYLNGDYRSVELEVVDGEWPSIVTYKQQRFKVHNKTPKGTYSYLEEFEDIDANLVDCSPNEYLKGDESEESMTLMLDNLTNLTETQEDQINSLKKDNERKEKIITQLRRHIFYLDNK